MDDFIDDSEAKVDISAEIRNIFGYDKRKFRDEVSYSLSQENILRYPENYLLSPLRSQICTIYSVRVCFYHILG